ncbi:2,3-bisphosphoglycerate-independent phosphoglycerate mutase [Pararhodospirillum oryzae]|uniref:2,3-bisphosphoglycerate-independent phosphoglycerate mutase n=1 Tax=Pararhodospirillum oryzae TaxID=478448 RepID=A0A512H8C3_9PROT|nr:2,3-bisphosphoglycerate-independent phosphoglycerate mutase [Pararhodospirillum oryzae]GEO81703.1 2,3-bisphosphoglycerate-independent phosphoglycerate mutase [Pararhodospirillum oryzae]
MTVPVTARPRPMVLCILDGWGHRDNPADNAIALARTPTWDHLMATCPHALVETSGLDVGLPHGQMGNSEVGHMNLGAGRVVMQDLPRIDQAIDNGSFSDMPAFTNFVEALRTSGGTAHVMGLLSPGGVHSHQHHMAVIARRLAELGIRVRVHAFLDGRDTPPRSATGFIETFQEEAGPAAPIATVSGRYYAMDRDNRWDRVEAAWNALVEARGEQAADPLEAVSGFYDAHDKGDEFVLPTVIEGYTGMADGDGVFFVNFRADRAREITRALMDPGFDAFARRLPRFAARLAMTEYSREHNAFMEVLFAPESLRNILGEVVSAAGLTQLRLAETEKYAHVTFFFNGGEETRFPGEERILVPSPRVATYDLKPEMSAPEVTDALVGAIEGGQFDVIIVNYANGDMVGHTGILEAAIRAVETVDTGLARVEAALKAAGGCMLLTADHGNAEMMRDPTTGEPHTAHTVGKVDLLLVNGPHGVGLKDGRLADIAPTLLALIGLKQPAEMTAESLLQKAGASPRTGTGE